MKMNEKIKDKYFVITIILVVILLFVLISIVIKIINNSNKKVLFTEDVVIYQYFGDEKKSYDVSIDYENNVIKNINNLNNELSNSSPVYIANNQSIFFTKDVSVVFYNQNGVSYRILANHIINKDVSAYTYKTKDPEVLNNFLLYDGKDLYVFFDNINITIDKQKISLTPFSYIIAKDDSVILYNYESEQYLKINDYQKLYGTNDKYQIDFKNDALIVNNNTILLQNDLDKLNILKED